MRLQESRHRVGHSLIHGWLILAWEHEILQSTSKRKKTVKCRGAGNDGQRVRRYHVADSMARARCVLGKVHISKRCETQAECPGGARK